MFQKIFYFFSAYADTSERVVGRFFAKLNSKSNKQKTITKLISLMQKNIVVINLLSERQYKGYKYLTKNKRGQLYKNVDAIYSDFNCYFINSNHIKIDDIFTEISNLGVDTSDLKNYPNELVYLIKIMDYFSPQNGKYKYRESSTFGELLKDPAKDRLQGDCNQIVTLYIYFYSLKYDIRDLQLKTYPGHVALHFKAIDIEATDGRFKNYHQKDQKILPIQEIVSINLLDTTDAYFKTHKVSAHDFLESAQLAYLVSSEKSIVNNNLHAAYNNIVNNLVKKNSFSLAIKYAQQSKNSKLIHFVGRSGAIFYLGKKQFGYANKFAEYSDNSQDLIKNIYYNQGVTYYNRGEYYSAIDVFKKIKNYKFVHQCYAGLLANEQKKLGKISTTEDIKNHRSEIRKMHDFAKRSEDKGLIKYTRNLTKYL